MYVYCSLEKEKFDEQSIYFVGQNFICYTIIIFERLLHYAGYCWSLKMELESAYAYKKGIAFYRDCDISVRRKKI